MNCGSHLTVAVSLSILTVGAARAQLTSTQTDQAVEIRSSEQSWVGYERGVGLPSGATQYGTTEQTLDSNRARSQRNVGPWHFTVAPYLISPTLGGTAAIGNVLPSAQVGLTAREVFGHPQAGGAVTVEVRKGSWSFDLDGLYADRTQLVTAEYQFLGTVCSGYTCYAGPDSSRVTGSMDVAEGLIDGLVFHRVVGPLALGVGGVGVHLQSRLVMTLPTYGTGSGGFVAALATARSGTKVWGDPVIGARWVPSAGKRWNVNVFGDIGAVSAKNRTWQLLPSLGYCATSAIDFQFAYRAFSTRFASGSGTNTFRYDITLLGPQLGIAVRL